MVDRANSSEFIKIGLNLKIAFDSSVVGMVTVYGLAHSARLHRNIEVSCPWQLTKQFH